MILEGKNIGFAMTGSFCTFSIVMEELKELQNSSFATF